MTVYPTSVNRTILIDTDGNPVSGSAPITTQKVNASSEAHLSRRELEERALERRGNLTVANWPQYNDTLAPSSKRTNFAVARDQSGMTVITGGNPE